MQMPADQDPDRVLHQLGAVGRSPGARARRSGPCRDPAASRCASSSIRSPWSPVLGVIGHTRPALNENPKGRAFRAPAPGAPDRGRKQHLADPWPSGGTVRRCDTYRSVSPVSSSRSSVSAGTTSGAGSTSTARARWSTPRSTPASRSSTPPTSTATRAGARRCSARCSRAGATRSCSRPSSAWTWAAPTVPTGAPAARAGTSGSRSKRRCGGCRPTGSTCTSCTSRTAITPLDETLAALDELVREGKVRYIGSSNLAAWQVADADSIARHAGTSRSISAQNGYSLLDRTVERELAPACVAPRRRDPPLLPARERPAHRQVPARRGRTDGHAHGGPASTRCATARSTASRRSRRSRASAGSALLDVAIGGLAAQPAVGSVIAGATRPEQVKANAAAGAWQPTADDLAALDAIAPRGTRA